MNTPTSPLPIKHPNLRPRIFDPFNRDTSDESVISDDPFEQGPGAIAMYGPAANRNRRRRRDDDLLNYHHHDDEDFSEYEDELDSSNNNGDDDVLLGTDDEQELGRVGQEGRRSDHITGTTAMATESRKKKSCRCLVACTWTVFVLIGVAAVMTVSVLFLGGDRKTVNNNDNQTTTTLSGETKDWIMVSEIFGSTDSFGFGVDFNSDATIVAVSAPKADNGRGQAEVFKRKSPVPTNTEGIEDWERLGNPIVGDSEGDDTSFGMDLSHDGRHLVVGYPGNGNGFVRVFRYENRTWVRQGPTLSGPSLVSRFGASVSINKNGTYLAVGAPLADQEQGMMQAYKWDPEDLTWIEHGNARYGDRPGDRFGSAVDISDNGDIVVVGAPFDDTRWEDGGRIYYLELSKKSSSIFENSDDNCRSDDGCWEDAFHENPFTGAADGNQIGRTLSLKADSDAYITSSIFDEDDGQQEQEHMHEKSKDHRENIGMGRVRAIRVDRTYVAVPNEVGYGVLGSREGEGFGYCIAADSREVSFAASSVNNISARTTGVVRVYSFEIGGFVQQGSDIGALPMGSGVWYGAHGTTTRNYGGPSVSMVGPRLAIGYQSVALDGAQRQVAGVVRLYNYQTVDKDQ